MEIKILRTVKLDCEGESKVYSPSGKIITIADDLAKEKNYVERYKKFPKHIEIVKLPEVPKKAAAKKKETKTKE